MNAKTTRILKEARPLFWPWCAVAAAGVLPLAHPPQLIELIWLIGFFLGIPLLGQTQTWTRYAAAVPSDCRIDPANAEHGMPEQSVRAQ